MWESKCKVVVDWTVGTGNQMMTALNDGMLYIGMCNNDQHMKSIRDRMIKQIAEHVTKSDCKFKPENLDSLIAETMPKRLEWYRTESRKMRSLKKQASDLSERDNKRHRKASW